MIYTLLSLDLSTTCCGYSYFVCESADLFGYIDYSDLSHFDEKIEKIESEIGHLVKSSEEIVVENFLMKFAFGKSSARTITHLSSFNGYFQGYCYAQYHKTCLLLDHVKALRYFIPEYDKLVRQRNYYLKQYNAPKLSVSKLIAFDFFLQHHPKFIPYFSSRNKQKLIKENFDISDAFINGKYHLEMRKQHLQSSEAK